jgi:hypothetical protein
MSLNDLKIGKPDLGFYTCEINMEMQRWVVSEEELYLHTIDNGDCRTASAAQPRNRTSIMIKPKIERLQNSVRTTETPAA